MYHSLEKRIWFMIIFLPLKESLILSRYGFFCYIFACVVPFGVIENRITKINFKYFNGNCNYSSPGWSILFLYAPTTNAWLFEKIFFELDYHWARLSLHFHIVLKSLLSYYDREHLFLRRWWYWQQNLLFQSHGLLLIFLSSFYQH